MIKDFLRHYLRSGKLFKRCLREAEERKKYSLSELREYQNEKLRETIKIAYKSVPFYRGIFKKYKLSPQDITKTEDLRKLPMINKEIVRKNFKDFRNRNYRGLVIKGQSSGTSGTPGVFLRDLYSINYEKAMLWRQYRWAGKLLDIFKQYNIYPTIYLCSHIVNTNRKFWFRTGFRNFQGLKKYSNKQRLKALKEAVDYKPKKEYAIRQALNLKELKEMAPYVDFQSHSKFHPILTISIDRECREEIEGSKDYLAILLNKDIKHYCYPNGDYADREIEYIKDSGYKSARTLDIGWNDINSDPYKLKAMPIQDDASVNTLCARISGFFGYLRYLRYGSFKGIHPPLI